jgi:hypothetical protein
MPVPLRICHRGRVAVVLASGAAISLTALSGGIVPALAEPGPPGQIPGIKDPSEFVDPKYIQRRRKQELPPKTDLAQEE